MACVVLLGLFGCREGSSADPDSGTPVRRDFVYADGTQLRTPDGAPFAMRGVNLGAWYFHETWITSFDYPTHGRFVVEADALGFGAPARDVVRAVGRIEGDREEWIANAERALAERIGATDAARVAAATRSAADVWDDTEVPLMAELERRYGVEGRKQVIEAFRDAFLQEQDIEYIASLGLNTIRVPTGWRDWIEHRAGEDPAAPLVFDAAAFARLDRLLDWCERHGLYVVLDLQDSPGGHNNYFGRARLYEDPEMQARTIELWLELSRRMRNRRSVAAYSLLAEPNQAPSTEAMVEMYDRLHDALRADGDEHLLVIHDGFRGLTELPPPEAIGWTGVIYSTHVFDWGVQSIDEYRSLATIYDATFRGARRRLGVPLFVGSFSTIVDSDFGYDALQLYFETWTQNELSWSLWTYKRIDDPLDRELFGETTMWGLRREISPAWERPDVTRDDLPTLIRKMSGYASVGIGPNERFTQVIRANTAN